MSLTLGSTRLLSDVLSAYGGLERWRSHSHVTAHVRPGGVLLPLKRWRRVRQIEAAAWIHEPRVLIDPYPAPGQIGVFEATAVRVEGGPSSRTRQDPRARFSGGLRPVRWDDLDLLYFAGYALWNYLTTPYLLTHFGVRTRELPGRRLAVTFPRGFHTHCAEQVFHFDSDHLLSRIDYTAEVFGPWARAAHLCLEHQEFEGIPVPTRRRALPRRPNGRPLPFPVAVSLELADVTFH